MSCVHNIIIARSQKHAFPLGVIAKFSAVLLRPFIQLHAYVIIVYRRQHAYACSVIFAFCLLLSQTDMEDRR